MRVLVTGASGFIGRHVVAELLRAGHQVSTLHRGSPLAAVHTGEGYDGGKLAGVEHIRADVLSGEARASAERAQALVHLAGWGTSRTRSAGRSSTIG